MNMLNINITNITNKINKVNKTNVFCIIIVFLIIIFRVVYSNYLFNCKYVKDENTRVKEVMVVRCEEISLDKVQYLVKYNNDNFLLNIYENKYAKIDQENLNNKDKDGAFKYQGFVYGDILSLRGEMSFFEKLNNPNEFNYKTYLNSKNIVASITTYDVKKVSNICPNIIFKISYFLRDNIGEIIDSKMPPKEANLFKSMVYGDDRNLDEEVRKTFQNIGISHLLAVSGSNIFSLILVMNMFIGRPKNKMVLGLNILCICVFLVISAFELSIIRASLMTIINMLCMYFKKDISKIKIIGISFLCMLVYNPYSILNVGFELSYMAIISIAYMYPLISSKLEICLRKIFNIQYIKTRDKKYLFKYYIYKFFCVVNNVFSLNLSILVFTLPLQIYYFSKFPLVTLISNLLLNPIILIIQVVLFLSFVLSYIPFVSDILMNSSLLLIKILLNYIELIKIIPLPTINIPKPNFVCIVLFYILIIAKLNDTRIIYNIKKRYRDKYIKLFNFVTILYILYNITIYVYVMYFESYILFFNVGQGNMTVIRNNRKNIVIDIGSTKKSTASQSLKNFLQAKAITKIDLLVITHAHEDHVNGLEEVSKSVKIDKIVFNDYQNSNKGEMEKLKKLAKEKEISLIQVQKNDFLDFENIKINILSPSVNEEILDKDSMNANSIVSVIEVKEKKYMFMGDATKKTEKYILEDESLKGYLENIHILQVGHHGSNTSTSRDFVNKIRPKYAIISSKKEIYGHPHKETLENLREFNVDVKITQNSGAIFFKIL